MEITKHDAAQRLGLGFLCAWLALGCGTRSLDVVHEGVTPAADASTSSDGSTPDGSGPDTNVEICNGSDDDNNGRIDDLDVGREGVCDCIRVTVLGDPSVDEGAHVLDTWLKLRAVVPLRRLGRDMLTAAVLADTDVLVVEDLSQLGRVFAAPETTDLEAFVRAGGGLFVLAGYGRSIDNANILLASFGLGLNPPDPLAPQGVETSVDTWSKHPVSEGVSNVIVIDSQATRGLGAELARAGTVEVARVLEADSGRVLVWGDDFIADYGTWRARSDLDIDRLWLNALRWLTRKTRCQLPAP